jgi:lysozyme family protein
MKSNFNDCLNKVLKDEGGYSNDPSDSGGATNFGITIADYRLYINKAGTPNDVRNMTVGQAKTIYRTKYWDALSCDSLDSGVDYTCFDYGVNSGLGRPRKALQRFKSLKGTELIDAINNERTTFLRAISGGKNAKFLNGWLARVNRVRNYSHYLNAHPADKSSGPVAGAAVGGFFVWMSTYWHQHENAILIGGALLALAIGTAVHYFLNKGK